MRTVEIDDRAYEIAESMARARNVAPGQVISEMLVAKAETRPVPRLEYRDGLPTITLGLGPITSEHVARLIDEDA
ncbi:MAG: hypothetical protein JNK87_15765 [Bryobacterales bacterium]|nr:hypothetical protein [Bryobacterales bacterium]